IQIDVTDITRSTVTVTLQADQATGGLPFATSVMRGADMLDAQEHPHITFHSRHVTGQLPRGSIAGNLTIKGVTQPVTLTAELFRQPNTDPNDLTKLAIQLQGRINRHDFGVSAYPGVVDSHIGLNIMAWVARAP
ncbi:MAG: YceI family protein, partial [Pseudomonadota bacterium]